MEFNICDVNKQNVVVKKISTTEIPLGPNKFPLVKNQFAHIPLNVQKLFYLENKSKFYKTIQKQITSTKVLIRVGVESGLKKNQSFLGLLADVYFNMDNNQLDVSKSMIDNLKTVMLDNLTIDKFISAQNGNLVNLFYKDINVEKNEIDTFQKQSIFLNSNTNIQQEQIIYVIKSYINFQNYIQDNTININYYYLWDLICEPINSKGILFKNGINLIIMNDIMDDVTNKIEIICPTNHFANQMFNTSKESILIYSRNDIFEPIYEIHRLKTNTKKGLDKKFNIKRTFEWKYFNKNKIFGIKNILEEIIKIYIEECNAKKSIENFNFLSNMHYKTIIEKLKSSEYEPQYYVSNTLMQIIGIVVKDDKDTDFFLPCSPSNIPTEENQINKIININDTRVPINDVDIVVDFLKKISQLQIPSEPIYVMVNDKMVVGILTQTNQVVLTNPEIYNKDHINLKVFDVSLPDAQTYYDFEEKILLENNKDTEREKVIKFIQLEDKYYTNFRNIFKVLINKNKHKEQKKQLKELIDNPISSYFDKIEKINEIIQSFLNPYVIFADFSSLNLNSNNNTIEEITSCFNLDETACRNSIYCNYITSDESTDGVCKVVIPKENLINQENNEIMYFMKMTDELIRHNKIRNYLLSSKSFLSLEDSKYIINDNEILLLEEDLLNKYKQDIVLNVKENYTNDQNVYDMVNPNEHNTNIKHGNIFNIPLSSEPVYINNSDSELESGSEYEDEDIIDVEDLQQENIKTKVKLPETLLYKFNNTVQNNLIMHNEKYYNIKNNILKINNETNLFNLLIGTEQTIIDILNDFDNSLQITKNNFRNIMKNVYAKIFEINGKPKELKNLLEYFIWEKKKLNNLYKKINKDLLITSNKISNQTISETLDNPYYIFTEIDIFVISYYYKLPIIILSGNMKTYFNSSDFIINNFTNDNLFAYILVSHTINYKEKKIELKPGLGGWYTLKLNGNNSLKLNKNIFTIPQLKNIKDLKHVQKNMNLYNEIKQNFDPNNNQVGDIRNIKNKYRDEIIKHIKKSKEIKLNDISLLNNNNITTDDGFFNFINQIYNNIKQELRIRKHSKRIKK